MRQFTAGDFRAARYAFGMTQREFGKLLGVSGCYVSQIETGARRVPVQGPVQLQLLVLVVRALVACGTRFCGTIGGGAA